MTKKQQIKLFEDKKVRVAWDDEKEEWYFSIVDVCSVLTDQADYDLAKNYWKVLKSRLKKEGNESVTNCNQLKMVSPKDGKRYKTDVADTEQLFRLIQSIPSPKAEPFNDLAIRILSHNGDFSADDFASEWRRVSAGVKTPIQIMLIKYVGKSFGGPLHDRYWICVDDERDKRVGISLNSISGLGQKESAILPIDDATALYALHSYSRYASRKIKRDDNGELEYESFTLT